MRVTGWAGGPADGVFDTSGEERRDVADAHSTEGVVIVIARGGPNS